MSENGSVLIGTDLVMKFEVGSYDWALSYDLNENSDCLKDRWYLRLNSSSS